MVGNPKYNFILFGLLVVLFVGCKKTGKVISKPQETYLNCVQVPNNKAQRKSVRLIAYLGNDSLRAASLPEDGIEFFLTRDSIRKPVDLGQLFLKHARYPEMLAEMEMEGRWIYELTFDQHLLALWTLRKSVENSVMMEKEIERVFNRMKAELRYSNAGKRTFTMRIQANFYD